MFNVIEGAFQIFMEQEMLHSLKLKLKVVWHYHHLCPMIHFLFLVYSLWISDGLIFLAFLKQELRQFRLFVNHVSNKCCLCGQCIHAPASLCSQEGKLSLYRHLVFFFSWETWSYEYHLMSGTDQYRLVWLDLCFWLCQTSLCKNGYSLQTILM